MRARATVAGSILVYNFGAEAPAEVGDDEADVTQRDGEERGQLGPHQERVLAGRPHRDLAPDDLRHDGVGSPIAYW